MNQRNNEILKYMIREFTGLNNTGNENNVVTITLQVPNKYKAWDINLGIVQEKISVAMDFS